MEHQYAAGGIIIKKKNNDFQVLLIKDSYGRWIWPKGHIEEAETPQDAALREVTEETGLKDIVILDTVGSQEYYFSSRDKRIFKTVYVFLMENRTEELLNIQIAEVQSAVWFSEKEALKTIEYEGSRQLLEKAIKLFKEKYL